MTTDHTAIVTPNASADNARNRPASLPRRQRVVSMVASAVISGAMLGGVVFGLTDSHEGPLVAAGPAAMPASAA